MAPRPVDPEHYGIQKVARRLLREPLLHFVLLSALIFVTHAIVTPPEPPADDEIVVTAMDAERLKAEYRATWNRDPSAQEFRDLVNQFVSDEIYYREGKSYGLDLDDQVVRLRMRQKMEFLLADPDAVRPPKEAELLALFEETKEKYVSPARIAFRQVFLGEYAAAALDSARSALAGGADPAAIGVPSLLPAEMELSHPAAVDGAFGEGFFARLAAVPGGEWTGPVRSAFGQHVVFVTEVTASDAPRFEDVRAAVEAEWRRTEVRRAAETANSALRERYRIDLSQVGLSE